MELIFTHGDDERFIDLCHKLDEYLNDVVGEEKQRKQYIQYNTTENIYDVALIIEDGKALACGGFKKYEYGTAEIKRVFTKEKCRNRGYSKAIMRALEARAIDKGYKKLILETGVLLKEAKKMYTEIGFNIIKNYGQYTNMPESVCMEKQLVR